jgi:1-deoxy-D-xylulose-5-phosphate synthase
VPDRYIEHGTQAQLYKECGYDAESIVEKAVEMCEARTAMAADAGMRIA